MLVKFIPGLEKYAMDSSNVTLLLLVVLASIVIKDIFEQKKLLKEYEAFWIYPIISAILLIGIALSPDITSDLFMILELLCSVKMGALQYELNKKSRNRMGSCTLYIPVLPDNTVIFDSLIMDGEIKVFGFVFYNTRTRRYETYGIVSDETLANVRDNEPGLYKKIMSNEPVNAQDYPLSCVWESNIPKEHDELLQYIIAECIPLYYEQLTEYCKYLDEESKIIFQLYGKRKEEVNISYDKFFSALSMETNNLMERFDAEENNKDVDENICCVEEMGNKENWLTYERIFESFCFLNEITVSRKTTYYHVLKDRQIEMPNLCIKKKRKKSIVPTEPDGIPENQLYMLISFVIKKFHISKEKCEIDLQRLQSKFPEFDKNKCQNTICMFRNKPVREIELCSGFYDFDFFSAEITAKELAENERTMKRFKIFSVVVSIFLIYTIFAW